MNHTDLQQQLQNVFPVVKVSTSELGGHTSIFVHASLDEKDTWINGIFHNSRYGIFSIADGKIELLSKGLNAPKFRKSPAKDETNVVNKLQQWVAKA